MKILILCTGGNSCRSLMAEAFLQKMDKSLEVLSAGLHPDEQIDPIAVQVMNEIGAEISTKKPKSYRNFEGVEFDYLITLCDGTRDKINPTGIQARHKIHLGFEDPRKTYCTEEQMINFYRDLRDDIRNELDYFYNRILAPEMMTKKKTE